MADGDVLTIVAGHQAFAAGGGGGLPSGLTWDGLSNGTLGLGSAANGSQTITGVGAGTQIHIQGADGDASHVGGELTLESGNSAGGNGGVLTIQSGDDTGGGDGGNLVIYSGSGTTGTSGDIDIRVGGSGNSQEGGGVNIYAGNATSTYGGWVNLIGGTSPTPADAGGVSIFDGTSSNSINVDPTGVTLGGNLGFYSTTPIPQQTGVAVSTAAIHAALVNLGLITA